MHENPNPGGFEEDAALTTVEAIEKNGGRAVYVSCDVTQRRAGRQPHRRGRAQRSAGST